MNEIAHFRIHLWNDSTEDDIVFEAYYNPNDIFPFSESDFSPRNTLHFTNIYCQDTIGAHTAVVSMVVEKSTTDIHFNLLWYPEQEISFDVKTTDNGWCGTAVHEILT